MKKIILGVLLAMTTFGTAQADITAIDTAYNSATDQHRFWFVDDGVDILVHTGDEGVSFGAALEAAVNRIGAQSVTWYDADNEETLRGQAAVDALVDELELERGALRSTSIANRNLGEQVIAAQNAGITFTTSTSGVHIATINYRFTNQYGPDSNFNANAEGANHDLTDADINMGTAAVHTTVNNAWANNIQGVVSDSDFRTVLDNAIDTAYSDGFDDGYHAGYGDGYDAGFADGRVTN